jgi:hypothetical protein
LESYLVAQPLQKISIAAPGFYGLNTQDSPIDLPPGFASVADNCIIDKYGRVGARKGYSYLTTTSTELGTSDGVTTIHEYTASDGIITVFSTGNNKILTGTTTLADATPGSYTITADNWQIVTLAEHVFFFQRGYEPLVYSEHDAVVEKMSLHTGAPGTPPQANTVLSAWGRLWVADFAADKHTIQWSDLLIGAQWTGGSSGSIDIGEFWPNGYDEITALAAHNNFLVIFGKQSILIYSGADDPSTMVLSDTLSNVGCIARDSVQNTGNDLIFLSQAGIQTLGRVIQEKSSPMRDASKNVRNDITDILISETGNIKSGYSPVEAIYVLTFPSTGVTYCMDVRSLLEDGSNRMTTWSGLSPLCYHTLASGTLALGKVNGIATYGTYYDDASSYLMQYYSNPMSFGDASLLKFLKKVNVTVIGGGVSTQASFDWTYDYRYNYSSVTLPLSGSLTAEYGVAEYNESNYTPGVNINRPSINTSGSGYVMTIGIRATIEGSPVSIQQLDVLALIGRII